MNIIVFEDLGVENVGDLLYLNEDDVHALGMRTVHQRKFERALTELRIGTRRALRCILRS